MNENQKDNFEFEIEGQEDIADSKKAAEPEIEVVDDTPEEDRGREPLPKALVEELEADELEDYSEKVKTRLKQMRKVWHDERREKERVLREHQEAVALAQRVVEENKRLKNTLSTGEQEYIATVKGAAELELDTARKAYKDAYDAGDSDKLLQAQERLSAATFKLQQVANYKPALQKPEDDVYSVPEQVQVPTPDAKTLAWQERNPWWGSDPEMTALALGLHQKLERENGRQFVGTDEYWKRVDKTMRLRFPEYFGLSGGTQTANGGGKPVSRNDARPANVVAPASRSTSPKRIVLKQSQLNLARKLGLTPEQYAREYAKSLEN